MTTTNLDSKTPATPQLDRAETEALQPTDAVRELCASELAYVGGGIATLLFS